MEGRGGREESLGNGEVEGEAGVRDEEERGKRRDCCWEEKERG